MKYEVGIMSDSYRCFDIFPVEVTAEGELRVVVEQLIDSLPPNAFVQCISPATIVDLTFSPTERAE